MEPLSSFAINIAAGIVLNMIFPKDKGIDKGIKNAFTKATEDWSKNKLIRERNIKKLEKERDQFLETLINTNSIPKKEEFSLFIELFNKRLCENTNAFNYLKEIKDKKRYLLELEYLKKLDFGQKTIIKKVEHNKKNIEDVFNIVKQILDIQAISSSQNQSTLKSLYQAKDTFENLINSNRKTISDKKFEIKKMKEEISRFEMNIKTINENINLLKSVR